MDNFICIIVVLFSFNSLAKIPAEILQYLEKNKAALTSSVTINDFSTDELLTIADRMADIIAYIFKPIMDKVDGQTLIRDEIKQHINEKIFSALPTNQLALDKAVTSLKEKYDGKLAGSILRIKLGENDVLLRLRKTPTGMLYVRLSGIGVPVVNDSSAQDCLWLTKYSHSPSEVEISWLGSALTACPLPKLSSKEMLTLGEDIARGLGAKTAVLEDQSKMLCNMNQKVTDFRILRIFQNKPSLYLTHGYQFYEGKDEVEAQTTQLKNLSLSTLVAKTESLGVLGSASAHDVFSRRTKEFSRHESSSDSFAAFMSWLWSKNFEDYIDVYQLIFDSEFKLVPDFNKMVHPKFSKAL